MVYKLHKNGSYNIHTINTDKFKTIRMEIIFRNNFNPNNSAIRTALFEILTENSKTYKTKRELNLKEEELYNAILYAESTKLGNEVISSINLEFLNPKYTEDDYLSDAIKLPFELIFSPNIKDSKFDENTLDIIKQRLLSELASINEDPKRKAIQESLTIMDSSSPSSKNLLGTKEEIEQISPGRLYEEYLYILKHDYIDIFIIGEFDENLIINLINENANFRTIKNHEINLFVNNKVKSKVKNVIKQDEHAQSQIIYIYNTVNLTERERKYTMQLYNMILGGGSLETKLSQNLRNKNSLCYGVQSIYNKYDNLLIIMTSVDKENIEKAKKLIKESISEMKSSLKSSELEHAVSSSISSINLAYDYPSRIIANYLFNYMAELDPMDERISEYKKITLDEVRSLNKKIKLNTIYVLEGVNNEED